MSIKRNPRYLGMTVTQWLVLGGLGLMICCTLIGGIWVLNSTMTSASTLPELPELTPQPTGTPLPTETPAPSPTATSIPYESLVPSGWKLFLSDADPGMQIWLPTSFQPQTADDKKKAIPILQTEGADDEAGVQSLLVLKDTTPSTYLILTTFELVKLPMPDPSLDQVIDDQFSVLTQAGRLQERAPFTFVAQPYEAQRLTFDINTNGVDAGLVVYVVRIGNDLYYLGFATPFNELYTRLPVFDQAAQTFRIVPVEPTPAPPTNTPLPQ